MFILHKLTVGYDQMLSPKVAKTNLEMSTCTWMHPTMWIRAYFYMHWSILQELVNTNYFECMEITFLLIW